MSDSEPISGSPMETSSVVLTTNVYWVALIQRPPSRIVRTILVN